MSSIKELFDKERAQSERRIADYRALVAMFIAEQDQKSKKVERVANVLIGLAIFAIGVLLILKGLK